MAVTFCLPDIGEGVHEAEVVSWLVKAGDYVSRDQPIVEVQTDKAVVELPSPSSGVVADLKWREGDVVQVGEILYVIEDREIKYNDITRKIPMGEQTLSEPSMKMDIPEGKMRCFTENFTSPAELRAGGEIAQGPGSDENLCRKTSKRRVLATPSTRRIARVYGVDLKDIEATGKDGRVTKEDVQNYIKVKTQNTLHPFIQSTSQENYPIKNNVVSNVATNRNIVPSSICNEKITEQSRGVHPRIIEENIEEIPLSSIRRVIGDRLLYSITKKPHATHFDELNVEGLVEWRNKRVNEYKSNPGNQPLSITYTSILLKLIAVTLTHHKQLNAHFNEENQKVKYYSSVSIGIATDTPKGLLVPVIHQVEKKSIIQLSVEISNLSDRAQQGKLLPEEMKGSTFTVSNAGTIGGQWATPIINPPEVAILAIHPIQQKPVVNQGELMPGWRMNVSLSFDHRVMDGADAIRFTQTLEKYTLDPGRLLAELF